MKKILLGIAASAAIVAVGVAGFHAARVAVATATPAPVGPYHISTYSLDITGSQGGSASAASVVKLLTYAEDGAGGSKTLSDCHSVPNGCTTVFYMDPNHVIDPSSLACSYYPAAEIIGSASESWFVHSVGYTNAAGRVYGFRSNGCKVWAMNPNSAGYQLWWSSFLRNNANGYDIYWLDDDYMMLFKEMYFGSGPGGCQPWPSKCFSTQEITDDAHMVLAHANLANALNHQNGVPMSFLFQQASGNPALDASAFSASARFKGMTCEGCISNPARPAFFANYAKTLDEMSAINNVGGFFLLISQGNAPIESATSNLQRRVTVGFVWLGYKEGYTSVWSEVESQNPTSLPVWPEDLIYPSTPLQSMISGHLDLQVAPGIYRREFTACYQKGVYFGHCATVVNGTNVAITVQSLWLKQIYHHSVIWIGGDVLSGGSAIVAGASFVAGITVLPAGDSLLLTP